ncbi:MAG: SDR family oxidoreductase [Verrucomicrobiales bacterium]|nr:SDR family oxidoreductase [Verrucomicrobiales bacterium]
MSLCIDLSDQVVLITGASQGIGAQLARTFHLAGATVLINHPNLQTSAQAASLAAELNQVRAESAFVLTADVSQPEEVAQMMQQAKDRFGGIHALINNAGILRDRTIAKMSLEDWRCVIDVNLSGVFHCCKFGLEIMHNGGSIVGLASIAGILGSFGQANYAAAKSGVQALMRVISREAARRSIRANAIAPGVIDTAMTATIPEPIRLEMLKQIPLGRLGTTEEVAQVAVFLCSPWASYVTGQTLEVNGGWRG